MRLMAKRKRGYSLYFNKQRNRYVGQLKCEIFGEEKRKSFYGRTKGEVNEKISDFKRRLKAGEFKVVEEEDPSETITLHELAEKIIEDQHDLNEISDSTYDRKCETLKKLAPIGNIRIKDITEDTVKKFLITQMGYSQSIINKVYQMLKGTLDEAVRKKYITEHPMISIKKPKTKQEKVKVRALTLAEQDELLDILKTKKVLYGDQRLLSMFTGMRMGEVNALDIRDIDFKHGVITVNKTVSLNTFKVEYIRKRTKTAAGMRRLRVNDEVLAFLRKVIGDRTEGRVFSTKQGGIVSTNKVNCSFSRLIKGYDVIDPYVDGKVDLHSLRHTYATRCIEGGMPPQVLQHILGHTDISTTLNTYCDTFDSYAEEHIAKADFYMKNNDLSLAG
jgi:integrase